MIDLILLVFVAAVYGAGFWCGKTYGSFAAMVAAVKKLISS